MTPSVQLCTGGPIFLGAFPSELTTSAPDRLKFYRTRHAAAAAERAGASSPLRPRFNGVDRKNLPPVLDGKEVFAEATLGMGRFLISSGQEPIIIKREGRTVKFSR